MDIASVPERSTAGASVMLLAADELQGVPQRVAYNPGAAFEHLAQGARAEDAFIYTIADAAGATSSATVHMSVIGLNDAPVALDDSTVVQEDAVIAASGNLLANDSDVDDGAVLAVAAPGTLAGRYGTLTLAANGDYSYALDNTSAAVQSLRTGKTVVDVFAYAASDALDTSSARLLVSVLGTNDAPLLAHDIADVSLAAGKPFSFAVSAGTFSDADEGDTLSFSATLVCEFLQASGPGGRSNRPGECHR